MTTEATESTETFEDSIRQHLIGNRARLVKNAVDQAIASMSESMKWGVSRQAEAQLNEFFTKEVGPEIKNYLEANRETIIAGIIGGLKVMVDGVLKQHAESMLEKLAKNSYEREKVVASMIGVSTR
jgi:hypothetical protein